MCFSRFGKPALERAEVLGAEVLLVRAAVHLERPHRRDDHRGLGLQPAHATLDVEELLGAEVRAEPRFGDDDVGQRERRARGENAVATMRDVAERPGVDERRPTFERLHEVRTNRVLEQERHRSGGAQLAGA